MSLSAAEVGELISLGLPILCVDTCTVLDVIRDITREPMRVSDAHAGLKILESAEASGKIVVLVAEQVTLEMAANGQQVRDEAEANLTKFTEQAERIHDLALAFGASGVMSTAHLSGHVGRAQGVLDRWVAVAWKAAQSPDVLGRAFGRVNLARTPARRGKDSMKDCVVVETYLETAQQLRFAGLTSPIVFASSNTKDYRQPASSHLQADIAADFAALSIEYAPNFGAAQHLLSR